MLKPRRLWVGLTGHYTDGGQCSGDQSSGKN
jgi:hypothetical protein